MPAESKFVHSAYKLILVIKNEHSISFGIGNHNMHYRNIVSDPKIALIYFGGPARSYSLERKNYPNSPLSFERC